MKTNEFIVQNESVKTFLKQSIDFNERDMENFNRSRGYHNFFKDKLHIKIEAIPKGIDKVFVFMNDESNAGSILVNKYTYDVLDYDSVSKELSLIDFEVSLVYNESLKITKPLND